MPIYKKWSDFIKDNVEREGDMFGAYEIGDRDGEIIYIGHGRLRTRLNSHFLQGSHPIPGAALYRLEELGSKERAEQRERALIREYMRSHDDMPPKYNARLG